MILHFIGTPVSHPSWHNVGMPASHALKQLSTRRGMLREDLSRLSFRDALNDCIALSELMMDMVEAFSSRKELIWIQNGFKPIRKTRRAKPQRSTSRS